MGYDIWIDRCDIRIDPAKHAAALAALADFSTAIWHLGTFRPAATLAEALQDRFGLEAHTESGSEGRFFSDGEWFRDHELEGFWSALAPFIDNDGELDFAGEDGEHWRFRFRRGRMYRLLGFVTYEVPPPDE